MATKKIENDNISIGLKKLLGGFDKSYSDKDNFLDIISWNLRWFNHREKQRQENICKILELLNADIFIFQEVEHGALDTIAAMLNVRGAGLYEVIYGTTGGAQRVAFMYDTEWIKPKDDIQELFGKGTIKTGDNKEVFPRLPLWGYFTVKNQVMSKIGFTFQLVGLHLKSQMGGGGSQRRTAADKLVYWLEKEANDLDSHTIMIGDWNKGPDDADWQPIHEMEKKKKVLFSTINDASDFSHLYYENKSNLGSRLDIALVSSDVKSQLKNKKADAIHWYKIDELINSTESKLATEIIAILNDIKQNISDHMPLHTRYYQTKKE